MKNDVIDQDPTATKEVPHAQPGGVFKIRKTALEQAKQYLKSQEIERQRLLAANNLRIVVKFRDSLAVVAGIGSEFLESIKVEWKDQPTGPAVVESRIDGLVFSAKTDFPELVFVGLPGLPDISRVDNFLDIGLFLARMDSEGKLNK
jgi:hypothetical protein